MRIAFVAKDTKPTRSSGESRLIKASAATFALCSGCGGLPPSLFILPDVSRINIISAGLMHCSTVLVNGSESHSNNTQTWPKAYIPNGAFYVVEMNALRNERVIITKKTRVVINPKWRSVDLDTPEEWVMAEILYKYKEEVKKRTQEISGGSE